MKNKKKTKKWVLPRHRLVTRLIQIFYGPIIRKKYGVKVRPFTEQGGRQYLVLYNHQTAYDQFFVGLAFSGAIYYLATEDIFSLGALSSLIRFLVNPIPIKKQTTDARAVINCIKVAKEGGSIAIAPEGNRTYSGKTVGINPTIAQLAKHLKLPIAIFKIDGGYGIQPRWSDACRKGVMTAGVSRVIEPEELSSLSNDELYELIVSELTVTEARSDRIYKGKALAEYLERVIYVCPCCGMSVFESHGDTIECKGCGLKVRHLENTELKGVSRDIPFKFVSDWYEYQCSYINSINTASLTEKPLYIDVCRMSEVLLYKKKRLISKSTVLKLYGDRVTVSQNGAEVTYDFSRISALTVLGKNKLNLYVDDEVYQFKGDPRFNALKYVNLYYRYKNITKGDLNDKFLGL